MRNRLKQLCGTLALAVAVVGLTGQAEAAAIVYVTPTPVVVEVGDQFSIDVMVDADDPVGGFDFDLAFNSTILTWNVFDITSAFSQFANTFGGIGPTSANQLNASLAGDPIGANLLTNAFQIARLTLTASALGVSAITLPFVDLSDAAGARLLNQQELGGVVCVVADKRTFDRAACVVPVPEPGLMVLLATGLATVAARRRRILG